MNWSVMKEIEGVIENIISVDAYSSAAILHSNTCLDFNLYGFTSINYESLGQCKEELANYECIVVITDSQQGFIDSNLMKYFNADTLIFIHLDNAILSNKFKDLLTSSCYAFWGKKTLELSSTKEVIVYKKTRFLKTHSDYFIQAVNTDNDCHALEFKSKSAHKKTLQESFLGLTRLLEKIESEKLGSHTFVRASDGDFYFLEAIPIGSATPGKRALTRDYSYKFIQRYRNLFLENDYITFEVEKSFRQMWIDYKILSLLFYILKFIRIPINSNFRFRLWGLCRKIINCCPGFFEKCVLSLNNQKHFDFLLKNKYIPSEAIYALVATRWIFRRYPAEIALIGSSAKIELIERLSGYSQFKQHLQIEKFVDLIPIPQIGAADNLDSLAEEIGLNLQKINPKIILIGAGSVKVGLLPLLRKYTNAVLIDVGCGIDAIAGVVCQDRPFFADWINFRIKDYPYEKIDFMDQGNPKWLKDSYKTVILD